MSNRHPYEEQTIEAEGYEFYTSRRWQQAADRFAGQLLCRGARLMRLRKPRLASRRESSTLAGQRIPRGFPYCSRSFSKLCAFLTQCSTNPHCVQT